MAEKQKKASPPYATYGSFSKFINDLRETGIPPRIDNTVFKTTSGSVIYSVLAALKYLKMIDEDGQPQRKLVEVVNANDADRPSALKVVLTEGYPSFFRPEFDLSIVSAGQFNDQIRDEFEVQGSTIDKIAAFFLSACKEAGIELSTHLENRKLVAPSNASKRSRKPRKDADGKNNNDVDNPPPPPPPPVISEKALEYRLVDLMSEAVSEPEVMTAIVTIITFLKTKEAKNKSKGKEEV